MYEYIKGGIEELTPTNAVIDAGGVGYHINISLHTFSQIEGLESTKLFIHFIVREDAQILYGFSTKLERELFRILISVSGVGGNTARTVLSTYTPEELKSIIATENTKLLKAVKGLGVKTAQKIIVELSDKIFSKTIIDSGETVDLTAKLHAVDSKNEAFNEAIEALQMLGYSKAACQKVADQIIKETPTASVQEIIRVALKRL
ncbi:MAG: Holliday junction branch migration protein RuvA [Rikenellaceae bacterium]